MIKELTAVLFNDDDGLLVMCAELDGAITYGDSEEEAIDNIKEAVEVLIETYKAENRKVPWENPEEVTFYGHIKKIKFEMEIYE